VDERAASNWIMAAAVCSAGLFLAATAVAMDAQGPPADTRLDGVPRRIDLHLDFDVDTLRGWQIVDQQPGAVSHWYTRDGALRQDSGIGSVAGEPASYGGTMAVVKNRSWADLAYAVKLKSTGDGGIGIVFRYVDPCDYYRVMMMADPRDGGPLIRLDKHVNGHVSILDVLPWQHEIDRWYVLTAVCQGSTIVVYLDGEPILSANDSSQSRGTVGLACCANKGAAFDEITVLRE